MVIYIIEDDAMMAECIKRATRQPARIFNNAVEAMEAINETPPDLIFLDILLTGPDGFTLLNELASYEDTRKIPIVVVTSLEMEGKDLSEYGVKRILNKATMRPEEIRACLEI